MEAMRFSLAKFTPGQLDLVHNRYIIEEIVLAPTPGTPLASYRHHPGV